MLVEFQILPVVLVMVPKVQIQVYFVYHPQVVDMEVKETAGDPLVVVVVPEDQVVDNQDNKVVLVLEMIRQFLPH